VNAEEPGDRREAGIPVAAARGPERFGWTLFPPDLEALIQGRESSIQKALFEPSGAPKLREVPSRSPSLDPKRSHLLRRSGKICGEAYCKVRSLSKQAPPL